ncbi:hypothetical protein [Bacteroides congonensis]|uniref:hypothetical protein n=1 Tax=Bacteroides congonensis TaxID=1871006 RepID=UPI001898D20F|nr:hypothetical protein [Bacteroides congonensis]
MKSSIIITEETISENGKISLNRKITVESSSGNSTVYEDTIPVKELFNNDTEINVFERWVIKLRDKNF